ncbi:hypothetical protein T265_06106 [Opisthorchis viverrini]|uniref:Uncharacterized protein n=1 Tax=Opisthorchis viverrini TaxID=6198 RepID=A0A074ZTI4_OPIVI|nr:hypothetical protein T265_06106 [Opisthorchis viverrini]KER26670.1 hypothetical protein T265_06106 [Opisthorchis viverrini]
MVRFPSDPRKSARNVPIHYLRRTAIAQQYRSELAQQLSTVKHYCGGSEHVDEAWQNVKEAILAAFSVACPTSPIRPRDHWMSPRSLSMINARKAIPAGNDRALIGARASKLLPSMHSSFSNPPLDNPLTVLDLCTKLPARACNAQLPTPSPKSSVNETAAAATTV